GGAGGPAHPRRRPAAEAAGERGRPPPASGGRHRAALRPPRAGGPAGYPGGQPETGQAAGRDLGGHGAGRHRRRRRAESAHHGQGRQAGEQGAVTARSGGAAPAPAGAAGDMELIDTHAHLDHEWFDDDRDAVVQRALAAGVVTIVTIGADVPTSEAAVQLAEPYPSVYAAVGIHPHDAKTADEAAYRRLKELAAHPKVVAVGEIGLDYYYDFSPREVQREVFVRQLQLARETGLPFIAHHRDASEAVMAVLREHARGLPGLLHSFTGDAPAGVLAGVRGHARGLPGGLHSFPGAAAMAAECMEMGWRSSLGGMFTFKAAGAVRDAVAEVPLERILLETDAPYLTPVPLRGRRNEPAYVRHVAEFLAAERGLDVAEVARVTTANARRLFHLP